MYTEEELLPLSGIQHFAFCPRQWALIHIEQQWVENVRTAEGRIMHERTHNADIKEVYSDNIITRSMFLRSFKLGLFGQADVIEFWSASPESGGIHLDGFSGYWMPKPIEYKRGKPKSDDRDRVQLCAQAVSIEEMMEVKIEEGALYYGETRRREVVIFTEELRILVSSLSYEMHQFFSKGTTPKAKYEKKCLSCSLFEICVPKVINRKGSINNYINQAMQIDTKDLYEKTS
jgi:CRISPR-associated exonuclease Cas4